MPQAVFIKLRAQIRSKNKQLTAHQRSTKVCEQKNTFGLLPSVAVF